MIETEHEHWIKRATMRSRINSVPIPDDVAKAIAAFYHSPSLMDEQITRVSHGIEVTDYDDLIRVIEKNIKFEQDSDYRDMLQALLAWAKNKQEEC